MLDVWLNLFSGISNDMVHLMLESKYLEHNFIDSTRYIVNAIIGFQLQIKCITVYFNICIVGLLYITNVLLVLLLLKCNFLLS